MYGLPTVTVQRLPNFYRLVMYVWPIIFMVWGADDQPISTGFTSVIIVELLILVDCSVIIVYVTVAMIIYNLRM